MFRNAFNCLSGTILCYDRYFLLFVIKSFYSSKSSVAIYRGYSFVVSS
nr:MAG TPA: hypothetical protein [Caudoviricetes sp.]